MPDHLKALRELAGDLHYTSLDDGTRLTHEELLPDGLGGGESYADATLSAMRERVRAKGHPLAWRLRYEVVGATDYCIFLDDCAVYINRGIQAAKAPVWVQQSLTELCMLRVQMGGNLEEEVGDSQHSRAGNHCSLISAGSGIRYGFQVQDGEPISSVVLHFHPTLLQQFFSGEQLEQLEMFRGGALSSASQLVHIPSTPVLMNLGRQMLALDMSQTSERLVARGIMLQLIGEAVGYMLRRSEAVPDFTRLRQQDIERLNAIRAHMDESLDSPHTIEELARWGGLNRRKLTEGFKLLFGTGVAQYLLRRRMLSAREMLEGGAAVGVAAEAVGYQDRTSFSRAFRRVHGYSPRAVQYSG